MTDLGRMNLLKVAKKVDFGVYLSTEDYGEILLPNNSVPENCQVDDKLNVFIYHDSEDRVIATTKKPKGMVEEFHCLRVCDVNEYGAFMDWGLAKDLFVPFKEQKICMEKDEFYTVFIYVDERSDRIVASSKLSKFLEEGSGNCKEGETHPIQVAYQTDIGYACIIDNQHAGMLYKNEVFEEITLGQKLDAIIQKIRPDGLIDLALQKEGYSKAEDLTEIIMTKLRSQGGFMPLNSKSPPEQISKLFGCSKKTFKMAIGNLYKKRFIVITDDGIKVASQNGNK
jgi:uncharacterized protein